MEIITCEFCGKSLQVPPSAYGQTVQCPMCKNTFQAKASGAVQSQAPPPLPGRVEENRYEARDAPRREDRWGEEVEDSMRRPTVPHRGALILVLGILGILMCGPFTSVPAWIMGSTDLKEMAAGRMDRSGEGLTRAGQIIGIIETVLFIVVLCGAFFFVLLA